MILAILSEGLYMSVYCMLYCMLMITHSKINEFSTYLISNLILSQTAVALSRIWLS